VTIKATLVLSIYAR